MLPQLPAAVRSLSLLAAHRHAQELRRTFWDGAQSFSAKIPSPDISFFSSTVAAIASRSSSGSGTDWSSGISGSRPAPSSSSIPQLGPITPPGRPAWS